MENQKLFLTLHLHLHPHPHPHNALCFSGYNHFGIHNLIWPTRQYCEIDIITQTFKRNNWRLRKGTEAVQDHLCVEFRVSSDSMVAFPAPDGLYLIPSRLLTKMISFWGEMEGASRAQRASGQVCAWKGAQGSVCRQTQRKEAPSQGRRQRGHQPSAGS